MKTVNKRASRIASRKMLMFFPPFFFRSMPQQIVQRTSEEFGQLDRCIHWDFALRQPVIDRLPIDTQLLCKRSSRQSLPCHLCADIRIFHCFTSLSKPCHLLQLVAELVLRISPLYTDVVQHMAPSVFRSIWEGVHMIHPEVPLFRVALP